MFWICVPGESVWILFLYICVAATIWHIIYLLECWLNAMVTGNEGNALSRRRAAASSSSSSSVKPLVEQLLYL